MEQTVTNVNKQKEAEAAAAAAKALEAAKEKDSQNTSNDLATTKKKLEESQTQLNQLKSDITKLQKEVADAAAFKSQVRLVNFRSSATEYVKMIKLNRSAHTMDGAR
jgi:septal ring factor EnvC (AmiA/AmiB activator)